MWVRAYSDSSSAGIRRPASAVSRQAREATDDPRGDSGRTPWRCSHPASAPKGNGAESEHAAGTGKKPRPSRASGIFNRFALADSPPRSTARWRIRESGEQCHPVNRSRPRVPMPTSHGQTTLRPDRPWRAPNHAMTRPLRRPPMIPPIRHRLPARSRSRCRSDAGTCWRRAPSPDQCIYSRSCRAARRLSGENPRQAMPTSQCQDPHDPAGIDLLIPVPAGGPHRRMRGRSPAPRSRTLWR